MHRLGPLALGTLAAASFVSLLALAGDVSTPSFQVRLLVDTNRDGVIDERDEHGKDRWMPSRGAVFTVNCDRNGWRSDLAGNPLPDAIHFNDAGEPCAEHWAIENDADARDLAPLLIGRVGQLPPGSRLFLRCADLNAIQAIHVYKRIAAGEEVIWGRLGDRVDRLGIPPALEIDVTSFVCANEDVTFGIEGLLFKDDHAPPPLVFNGLLDLTLELRDAKDQVLGRDHVQMRVAPWLMISNREPAEQIWAMDRGDENAAFRRCAFAERGYVGLDDATGFRTCKEVGAPSQFFQDHVEFGYTQRPGQRPKYMVLRTPNPQQPTWPMKHLLRSNVGVFQIGDSGHVGGDGDGDKGGNLELLPPTPKHQLGRIVVGDSCSRRLWNFLNAQEVQAPFEIPTRWLATGHVDEIVAFTGHEVVMADSSEAYKLLQKIPVEQRGTSVFFASGRRPMGGVVAGETAAPHSLKTGQNLSGQPWHYLRIYSDNGSGAAGQIAHIKQLGDGVLEVDRVWRTPSKIIPGRHGGDCLMHYVKHEAPHQATWFVPPGRGDRFVLVENVRFWMDQAKYDNDVRPFDGTPALITVAEVLADDDLAQLNLIDVNAQLQAVRVILEKESGGSGVLQFVPAPVLFFGRRDDRFATDRSVFAFTPNLVNLQPLGGKLYCPRQFGPRATDDRDVFEKAMQARLPNAVFVDDWDLYHRAEGEVHCATAVKRAIPQTPSWENQP